MEISTLLFVGGGILLVVIIITAIVTFKIIMWLADIFTPRYSLPYYPVILPNRAVDMKLPKEERSKTPFFTYLLITTLIVSLMAFLPQQCSDHNYKGTDRIIHPDKNSKNVTKSNEKQPFNRSLSRQRFDESPPAFI